MKDGGGRIEAVYLPLRRFERRLQFSIRRYLNQLRLGCYACIVCESIGSRDSRAWPACARFALVFELGSQFEIYLDIFNVPGAADPVVDFDRSLA